MKKKWLVQVAAFMLMAGVTAMCSESRVESETEDVLEEQREAAEAVAEDPTDTARIRREAQDVIEEQRQSAAATRQRVAEEGLDTLSTTR